MNRAYYKSSISDFITEGTNSILGQLKVIPIALLKISKRMHG